MYLIKFMRVFRCKLSAATWIPMVLYIAFITFMLSITFPNGTRSLKAHSRELTSSESSEEQGELNRVFNGEIKDIEPMVLSENSEASNVLKFAFRKADSNGDGSVTIRELARYINLKISDHIGKLRACRQRYCYLTFVCSHLDSAIKSNPQIFSEIDKSPIDGLVSWNEYHTYFLKNLKLGLDENYITNHDEKKHIKLDRKSKEALMRDKARWTEVLASDPASLTLDEFLAFQHPEASTSNLLNLVEDILRHFDTDGDDLLTTDEFTNTYSSSADNKKLFLSDNLQERRAEFTKLIDKNHDEKVSL